VIWRLGAFAVAAVVALPLLGGRTVVQVEGELISKPYVEITLNAMRQVDVQVDRDGWTAFTVPAGARYVSPGEVYVEGDASSASYFLAAGAILFPGSLYSVSFGGPVFFAPYGGTAAMIGWALFGVGAVLTYVRQQPTT